MLGKLFINGWKSKVNNLQIELDQAKFDLDAAESKIIDLKKKLSHLEMDLASANRARRDDQIALIKARGTIHKLNVKIESMTPRHRVKRR